MRKGFYCIVVLLFFQISWGQTNRCSIQVGGKTGFIDTNGRIVIQPQYDYACQFSENFALVSKNNKYGFIDTNGKIVIDLKFDMANRFCNGYATAIKKDQWGLIDKNGVFILKPKYECVSFGNENHVGVKQNNKWGFYSIEDKTFITDFKFDEVGEFRNDRAWVRINDLYGFINKKGQLVIEPKFIHVDFGGFYFGLAAVRDEKTHKYGFIDTTGAVAIDFQFNNVDQFRENKAYVQESYDSKGYFINTNGQKIFDKTFDSAWGFSEGVCGVKVGEKYGIIDSLGNWIVEPRFDWLQVYFNKGWIAFYNIINGQPLWGIINLKGEVIFDAQFFMVIENDGDCPLPEIYTGNCINSLGDCSKGYVNLNGKVIWNPTK
jgi:hypothetical protein